MVRFRRGVHVPHVIHRVLPCGHQHIRVHADGSFRRVCRTCKRAWLGHLVRAAISDRVGQEVLKVEWEEMTA